MHGLPSGWKIRDDSCFYGWWVVLAASVQGFFGVGIVISGFLVFFLPIRNELDLSSAAMSLVIGLAWAISGVVAPAAGWLADRFGTRRLVLIGGLLTGVGLVFLSFSTSYWHLLLFYSGIVSIGRVMGTTPTLMISVNQWFVRRKALAISILSTCFVSGGAALVPLLAFGNAQLGWRTTLLFAGIFISVLALPVALVLRNRPEDLGLQPDGDTPRLADSARRSAGTDAAEQDFSVRQALSTSAFWLVLAGLVLRVSVADAVIIHQIPLLVWKGVDEQSAALFLSLMFFLAIPLRFSLGLAGGYFSARWLLFIGMGIGALGTAFVSLFSGTTAAFIFVTGLAVVEGIATTNWLVVGQYFGRKRFGSLVGIMTVFHSMGALISPVISGWVFDSTESYSGVLLAAAPLFLLGGVAFLLARRPGSGRPSN
ncbi:MAG: MFS transporter [Chloroflexi bacterium]|nr:MFS transporter [Chloroflexota bacterium]